MYFWWVIGAITMEVSKKKKIFMLILLPIPYSLDYFSSVAGKGLF